MNTLKLFQCLNSTVPENIIKPQLCICQTLWYAIYSIFEIFIAIFLFLFFKYTVYSNRVIWNDLTGKSRKIDRFAVRDLTDSHQNANAPILPVYHNQIHSFSYRFLHYRALFIKTHTETHIAIYLFHNEEKNKLKQLQRSSFQCIICRLVSNSNIPGL